MVLNSSPTYLENHVKLVFDCNTENGVILPFKEMFIKKKIKQFTTFYMFHKDVATPHSEITEDLLSKSLDTQLNALAMTIKDLHKETDFNNKRQAKMTNTGFSQGYIPLLTFVLLSNNCNLPTT